MENKKEASARIKINKLLEVVGWRFFDDKTGKANILLENTIRVKEESASYNGVKVERGFIDYLLLDKKSFPLAVLEAKQEDSAHGKGLRGLDCGGFCRCGDGVFHLYGIRDQPGRAISFLPSRVSFCRRAGYRLPETSLR